MPRLILMATVLSCAVSIAAGHPPGKTFTYPRVYGATGHLYGPTQAHYQYQRQYGQPWHGYNGINIHGHRGHSHHSYYSGSPYSYSHYFGGYAPYTYGGYGTLSPYSYLGFGGYIGSGYGIYAGPTLGIYTGPTYGFPPAFGYGSGYVAAPVLGGSSPTIPGSVFNNAVIQGTINENRRRWLGGLDLDPPAKTVKRISKPSSTTAKLKSLQAEVQGNAAFRRQDYPYAIRRYKQAISAAKDRADPYFRLGLVFIVTRRYHSAVQQIRRGLEIDPSWPETGPSLEVSFGPNNRLARLSTIRRVADSVREDIRDPDRLFLLGVLLHFNDDTAQAKPFFETALRLDGEGEHIKLFLRPPTSKTQKPSRNPTEKSPDSKKNGSGRFIPPSPADAGPPIPEPPTDEPPTDEPQLPQGPALQPPKP